MKYLFHTFTCEKGIAHPRAVAPLTDHKTHRDVVAKPTRGPPQARDAFAKMIRRAVPALVHAPTNRNPSTVHRQTAARTRKVRMSPLRPIRTNIYVNGRSKDRNVYCKTFNRSCKELASFSSDN
jgi:hypothetical protein